MNNLYTIIFCISGWVLAVQPSLYAQGRCGTSQLEAIRNATQPEYRKSREKLEHLIQSQAPGARTAQLLDDTTHPLIIPVVVHVVHTNASQVIGGSNISDKQIYAQIRILNEDFRRKKGTLGFNNHPVGADMNIEFRLAATDPAGQPTSGITRHYYKHTSGAYNMRLEEDRLVLADIVSWATDCYLNIWVVDLIPGDLGFAQFPDASSVSGLADDEGPDETDGIWIDYTNFGIGPEVKNPLYRNGRTTTHEAGHWLGLLHVAAAEREGISCLTDYVEDTPFATYLNESEDMSCKEIFSDCHGNRTRNMIENYMDYSPDPCMHIFTQGQKMRVSTVLALSPRRRKLLECSKQMNYVPDTEILQMKVYASVARVITLETEFQGVQDIKVEIFDHLGRRVRTSTHSQVVNRLLADYNDSFMAGVYFVRVQTATESQIRKLVIW